jgi:CubicO group peptidase (beta-lactamase class C family)
MDAHLVVAAARCAEERLKRHRGAGQLVVLRRGQVVLDRAFGAGPRDLFVIYSTSKPYTAMLVHLLVERGELSLDEPIAAHWPEFGSRGKEAITPRHVLTHRAGVPDDNSPALVLAVPDWQACARRMERLQPRWPPGQVTAYHALTYGWILGELVRRVSGTPVEDLLARRLLRPLGLRDTFLGLPEGERARAVRLVPAGGRLEAANALVFNRFRHRHAVVPAATISATARDVARFYEMLRRGGELNGRRVLSTRSVAAARLPAASEPEEDRSLGRRVRWAHGFHLGGVTSKRDTARCMGDLSSPEAFGHNGSCCCTAWCDPRRELVFVYLTSLLLRPEEGIAHHGLVADCVLRACG